MLRRGCHVVHCQRARTSPSRARTSHRPYYATQRLPRRPLLESEDKPIATYATQRLFAKIGRTRIIFLLIASIVYTEAGIFLIIAVKFKLLIKEQGIAT